MQRLSISATGAMLASVIAFAQPPNGGGPGSVLGIVEIPEIFFVDPDTGGYAPRAALTLYRRPDSDGKVAAVIRFSAATRRQHSSVRPQVSSASESEGSSAWRLRAR